MICSLYAMRLINRVVLRPKGQNQCINVSRAETFILYNKLSRKILYLIILHRSLHRVILKGTIYPFFLQRKSNYLVINQQSVAESIRVFMFLSSKLSVSARSHIGPSNSLGHITMDTWPKIVYSSYHKIHSPAQLTVPTQTMLSPLFHRNKTLPKGNQK